MAVQQAQKKKGKAGCICALLIIILGGSALAGWMIHKRHDLNLANLRNNGKAASIKSLVKNGFRSLWESDDNQSYFSSGSNDETSMMGSLPTVTAPEPEPSWFSQPKPKTWCNMCACKCLKGCCCRMICRLCLFSTCGASIAGLEWLTKGKIFGTDCRSKKEIEEAERIAKEKKEAEEKKKKEIEEKKAAKEKKLKDRREEKERMMREMEERRANRKSIGRKIGEKVWDKVKTGVVDKAAKLASNLMEDSEAESDEEDDE